jgi:hypothetical protein
VISEEMVLTGLSGADQAGGYALVVTDEAGCTVTAEIFVTGVSESGQTGTVLLFPNPATERLGVLLSSDWSGKIRMEVYDLAGRMLRELPGEVLCSGTPVEVGIADFAAGQYVIRITSGDRTVRLPFRKM